MAAEGSESLPFVPFSNFNGAKYSDKLFLYGPSGCGKSRAIFELVRENLGDFKKVYFINPRNTEGDESGRIKLINLIGKLEGDDGVVWVDPLAEAEKLLRSTHYYEHQFVLISSIQERRPDAEFLYTLKLCYESGLNRTISYVEQLQKKIFGGAPSIEPIRR